MLAAAQALGHVDVNAAGEVIDAALPKTPKPREHRRALPYADVPAAPEAVEASGAGPVVKDVGGRPLNGDTLIKALRRATGTGCGRSRLPVEFPHVGGGAVRGDQGRGGDGPCPRGRRGCRAELRAKRSV